jgi:arylsulfatase A-like enzyme
VHYVDPHAPYRTRRRFTERLDVGGFRPPPADRYDTEVAFVDEHLGRLVAQLTSPAALGPDTLFVLTADHGESLGEHDYWGHGRNLYEETVRIPLGIWWNGKLAPRRIAAPASILDVAPTVLGLLGRARAAPPQMAGLDWSAHDFDAPPPERTLWLQAHEGVALGKRDREQRANGLLEIGFISGGTKQSWRLAEKRLLTFELGADRRELRNLTLGVGEPPPLLRGRLRRAEERLVAFDPPAPELDAESIEMFRALGYLQ